MSFFGGNKGGSSNKSTSTDTANKTQNTTTNTNTNTTPTLASYQQQPVQNYYGMVGNMVSQASQDPTIAQQFIPGASANQQLSYRNAAQLGGQNSYFGQAGSLASQAANSGPNTYGGTTVGPTTHMTAASLNDNGGVQSYMNPYMNSVINPTLAAFDQNAGAQQAALAARGAANGAFSGSRYGLQQNDLTSQLALSRAQTQGGLLDSGWNQAINAANSDAGRRQDASSFNAGAQNTSTLAQAGYDQSTGTFNAAQRDNAANRQLQAAQTMGQIGDSYGQNARGDVASQLATGQDDRSVQTDQKQAQLQYLAYLQNLLGVNGNNLIGQQQVGTGTTNDVTNATSTDVTNSSGKSYNVGGGITF